MPDRMSKQYVRVVLIRSKVNKTICSNIMFVPLFFVVLHVLCTSIYIYKVYVVNKLYIYKDTWCIYTIAYHKNDNLICLQIDV